MLFLSLQRGSVEMLLLNPWEKIVSFWSDDTMHDSVRMYESASGAENGGGETAVTGTASQEIRPPGLSRAGYLAWTADDPLPYKAQWRREVKKHGFKFVEGSSYV